MPFDQTTISGLTLAQHDDVVEAKWSSTSPAGTVYQVYEDGLMVYSGTAKRCRFPVSTTGRQVTVQVGTVAAVEKYVSFTGSLPALPGGGQRAVVQWYGGSWQADDLAGYNVYASAVAGGSVVTTSPVGYVPAEAGSQVDGYGLGPYGVGPYGIGAALFTFVSEVLTAGTWTFLVRTVTTAGVEDSGMFFPVVVAGPPTAPPPNSSGVRLAGSYVNSTRILTLTWLASSP